MGNTLTNGQSDRPCLTIVARSIPRLLLVACSAYLLLDTGIVAAEWRFDPVMRAAWDFDDNATLSGRTDEEVELSGYIAEASVDFFYDTENGLVSFRPMLR